MNFRVFILFLVPVVLDGAFFVLMNCNTPIDTKMRAKNPPHAIPTIAGVSSFVFEISASSIKNRIYMWFNYWIQFLSKSFYRITDNSYRAIPLKIVVLLNDVKFTVIVIEVVVSVDVEVVSDTVGVYGIARKDVCIGCN